MINKIDYFYSSTGKKYNSFSGDRPDKNHTNEVSNTSIKYSLLNRKEKSFPQSTIGTTGYKKFPLLAIDGGGTKTIAAITDSNGNVLSIGNSGTSNYQIAGKKSTIKTLKHVIEKTIDHLREIFLQYEVEIRFNVGVFALAGIDTQKDEANVQKIVKQAIRESGVQIDRVIVENDALSVLLGETNRSPGVILISGTGSIALAHDGKGNYVRAGGWGHRLGDEGGGYWIGKEAIRTVLKMYDGRGPKTVLSDLVLNHFQLEDHEQLYNWVYGPDYSIHDIGKLSTIVEEANRMGDLESKYILNRAVTELYCLVSTVVKRANISDEPFKLLFLGGVLQNSAYVRNKLVRKVKENLTGVVIITDHGRPIDLIIQRGLNV